MNMKLIYNLSAAAALTLLVASCQDKSFDVAAPVIAPIEADAVNGSLSGNDYIWTWNADEAYDMAVTVYSDGVFSTSETVTDGNIFTHHNVETGIDYTYVFKLTDGSNLSKGVVKYYSRPGAMKMSGLALSQTDKPGGYDMLAEWDLNTTATEILLNATNGSRSVTEHLAGDAVSFSIADVAVGEEWTVTLTASNKEGSSMPVEASLRIGKTAIGFLSVYSSPEELIENGDDDEASAWLWLAETYPTAEFISFASIESSARLEPFRVLFWMRDIEGGEPDDVFDMPECVEKATPAIRSWYADGGSLLLWSHATVYVGMLGRLDMDMLRANDHSINTASGGINNDSWSMAVSLNPGKNFTRDHSSHPIYRGLTVTSNDRCKLVAFKGPGWTEDHNCLFFNIPAVLTGLDPQSEECYDVLTNEFGIYPLGTWDSQIDWVSQLNVWEARQGNTEFKGTILCIGNGGCEFSMKNPDGTPDISARPSVNIYQENILTLARNSLEYLKTR